MLQALKKDFFTGIVVVVVIILIYTAIKIFVDFFAEIFTFISEQWLVRILLGIGLTILIGALVRKISVFKSFEWITRFLPTQALNRPEIAIEERSGIYETAIHLKDEGQYIRTGKVNAGPTGFNIMQDKLIIKDQISFYTGKKTKDLIKILATGGIAGNGKEKTDI